jgi:DNA repair exonuclease SbcCD ATPase subunit
MITNSSDRIYKKQELQIKYLTNKAVKAGTLITCPVCGTEFIKKSYHHTFCNGKCRDTYWNYIDDKRYDFLNGRGTIKMSEIETKIYAMKQRIQELESQVDVLKEENKQLETELSSAKHIIRTELKPRVVWEQKAYDSYIASPDLFY